MSEPRSTFEQLARPRQAGSANGAARGSVPRPPTRWVTRYLVPVMLIVAAGGLMTYAARDVLTPAIEVDVVPVIVKAASLEQDAASEDDSGGDVRSEPTGEPTIIAQAPGWIEPDPYAITVPALEPGVVREVLVLEGDRVEAGQTLVRLIDEDAQLAVDRATARLAVLEAELAQAEAAAEGAEAQVDEVRDEVERKQPLVEHGGVSEGEFARLTLRLQRFESEHAAAHAAVQKAEARIGEQQAAVAEAALALARMVIRAPIDGVVLSRTVTPGSRIANVSDGVGEMHMPGVVTIYDPARLQVRADIAISDAARVTVGTTAQITTDALPDRTFSGEVTRIVHRADIQRNTVKVKVRIDDPSPVLKPDMICRVRFLNTAGRSSGQTAASMSADTEGAGRSTLRIFASPDAIIDRDGDRGRAWVIVPSDRSGLYRVERRDLTLGGEADSGVLVRNGLRPGDRLIVDPPANLAIGARVRIRGDRREVSNSSEKGA